MTPGLLTPARDSMLRILLECAAGTGLSMAMRLESAKPRVLRRPLCKRRTNL